MKKVSQMSKKAVIESRTAQIDREIEPLVSGFVAKPNKGLADSLYYLTRERAKLLQKGKPSPRAQQTSSHEDKKGKLAVAV
jgi:hypothetical protein